MSLKGRLIRQMRMDGPMPVSTYMQTCLHDPVGGYYANGAGLGRDFTTSPEISQMFGELIGLWIAAQWQALGQPEDFQLVEIGGGRGTLMADALRATRNLWPESAAQLCLVEASPVLRQLQAETLAAYAPQFFEHVDMLPDGPMVLVANEFLDCLPARQFVRDGTRWRERVVGVDDAGTLVFGVDRSDITPEDAAGLPSVSIEAEAEIQPGLHGVIAGLSARTQMGTPFRALFVDYGPDTHTPADSLRAYKAGEQVHPLACPGEADLTVDVDFTRLAKLAERAGLGVAGPITQSAFLGQLGLQARLDRLIKASPDEAEHLFAGAQKLVDPAEMGTRFKAICLSSLRLPAPIGFG